jgi:hypothetical protein
MHQSRTLYLGLDVRKESIAVAYVTQAHHAEGVSLDAIGTRPCDSEQLIRQMQAKSKQLILVSEAGPCGYWLYRYLTKIRDLKTAKFRLQALLLRHDIRDTGRAPLGSGPPTMAP